jgi:hypothetical protein
MEILSRGKILDISIPAPHLKEKVEGGPLSLGSFSPDGAPMPLNDSLNRGQSDPGPRKAAPGVEPRERAEEFVRVFPVEAHPVIPHKQGALSAHLRPSEFNHRPGAIRRELPRIFQ